MQHASEVLLQRLYGYIPEDEAERTSIILVEEMIAHYPNIWLQSCQEGHITGSALILDIANRNVLLMYHRKLELWLQMGGHGEGELDPALIALREATEESALPDLAFFSTSTSEQPTFVDVDAHSIPARRDTPEHYHLDFRYLLSTSSPEKIRLPKAEAHDLRWYPFSEMPALPLKPATRRLIKKAERLLEK